MSELRSALRRALIPAAGLGTRMRPLTSAIPKEMLPLGRKPVLEYVVEELRDAGLDRLLFVISPGKEMIRQYFGTGERWGVYCDYVVQPEMLGLGDAILQGESWTEGEMFAVAFGDCLIESRRSSQDPVGFKGLTPLARMLATQKQTQSDVTVLTERISRDKTRKYGILTPLQATEDPLSVRDSPFALRDIVEKPAPEEAPSLQAVAARYLLAPSIFESLRSAFPDGSGEVNLTDSVRKQLSDGAVGWAVPLLSGEARRDIGGWETYLAAASRMALLDADYGGLARKEALPLLTGR